MRSKKLGLIFGLSTLVNVSSINHAQGFPSLPSGPAIAKEAGKLAIDPTLFATGIGIRLLVEWLIAITNKAIEQTGDIPGAQGEEHVEAVAHYARNLAAQTVNTLVAGPEESAQKETNVSPGSKVAELKTQVKAVGRAVEAAFALSVNQFVKQLHSGAVTPAQLKSLAESVVAGLKAPRVYRAILGLSKFVPGLIGQVAKITPNLANTTLEGAALQLGALKKLFDSERARYAYDLGYPISFKHSTSLDCGPLDPYCLESSNEPEMSREEKERAERASELILGTLELGGQLSTFAISFIIGYLGYVIGEYFGTWAESLITRVPEGQKATQLLVNIGKIVEPVITEYVETQLISLLTLWFWDLVEQVKDAPSESPEIIAKKSMDKTFKVAQKGPVLQRLGKKEWVFFDKVLDLGGKARVLKDAVKNIVIVPTA